VTPEQVTAAIEQAIADGKMTTIVEQAIADGGLTTIGKFEQDVTFPTNGGSMVITHNKNSMAASCALYDSNGTACSASITEATDNSFRLTTSTAFTGKIICVFGGIAPIDAGGTVTPEQVTAAIEQAIADGKFDTAIQQAVSDVSPTIGEFTRNVSFPTDGGSIVITHNKNSLPLSCTLYDGAGTEYSAALSEVTVNSFKLSATTEFTGTLVCWFGGREPNTDGGAVTPEQITDIVEQAIADSGLGTVSKYEQNVIFTANGGSIVITHNKNALPLSCVLYDSNGVGYSASITEATENSFRLTTTTAFTGKIVCSF